MNRPFLILFLTNLHYIQLIALNLSLMIYRFDLLIVRVIRISDNTMKFGSLSNFPFSEIPKV